jgi:hypothetical protein
VQLEREREREGEENGGEFLSKTVAMPTFLLGCCGGVELPLRMGEELARSGVSRWVSGDGTGQSERKNGGEKKRAGFILLEWRTVGWEQEKKMGWVSASPLATGGGVDVAGSVGGGFGC